LKELSEASGVSGYEFDLRKRITRLYAPWADEVTEDVVGSVIARRAGYGEPNGERHTIMLAGHMDEIGLIVTELEKGFLRFHEVGGFDQRTLLGQEVLVHGRETLPGIIGSRPPHVLAEEARSKPVDWDDMFIDVGLEAGRLAELVQVGDLITIRRQFQALEQGRVTGKAFDDRTAVVAIGYCLEQLAGMRHSWDVYGVATAQEETGLIGATTSAYGLKPDIAIAIDVGFGDMPGVGEMEALDMGGGPAISLGANIHPLLRERLVQVAETHEIPYQIETVPGRSGTDAWAIQVSRQGIPTALLSIPLRYMHTSVETVVEADIARTGRLLAHFIGALDAEFAAQLGV
jgi:endoglucanase